MNPTASRAATRLVSESNDDARAFCSCTPLRSPFRERAPARTRNPPSRSRRPRPQSTQPSVRCAAHRDAIRCNTKYKYNARPNGEPKRRSACTESPFCPPAPAPHRGRAARAPATHPGPNQKPKPKPNRTARAYWASILSSGGGSQGPPASARIFAAACSAADMSIPCGLPIGSEGIMDASTTNCVVPRSVARGRCGAGRRLQ